MAVGFLLRSLMAGAIANGPIFREAASATAGAGGIGSIRACELKTGNGLEEKLFETDFKVGSSSAWPSEKGQTLCVEASLKLRGGFWDLWS